MRGPGVSFLSNLPVCLGVPDLIPPFAAITHPAVPPPINFSKHESLKNNFEIL